MLVAKVTPLAKKIYQTNPFTQAELTADSMVAKCTQLNISPTPNSVNDEIVFSVRFGNIKYYKNPDGSNANPMLDVVIACQVKFTQSELSDWGTDDTIVYTKIAQKLGFTISSTENLPLQGSY